MSKPLKKKGDYEIRNQEGDLDEVVVKLPQFIHIEQMAGGHWWIGIDIGKKKRIMVNFTAKSPIRGTAYLD